MDQPVIVHLATYFLAIGARGEGRRRNGRRVEGDTPLKKKFLKKVPKEAGQIRHFMGMLNESD
ncbi:hypothetical protein [Crystallibacter degradans]|uniref:hypothetical protein n=1 Tax=Crystallibacter degradans TaxID=2726743 RepID=UPI001472C3F0|nr:hypothetical protein [Arthrobacter sp. SF27]NMR28815.1 hypothetical protein [Arthrobacter sp. SF27]